MRPELELCLVESNVKKGTFLAEVVRELQLTNTRVLISRYEELGEELTPLDLFALERWASSGHFWSGRDPAVLERVR